MSSARSTISLSMAIIVGINALVGAGIFSTPSALQVAAGPASLLTYTFVIAAVLFMALSFARVAMLYPKEGSFYGYAKIWGGQIGGILSMTSYMTGLIIALGLMTKIIGNYIALYLPHISPETISLVIIGLLVLANIAGAVISQIGQIILIVLTILPIILITGLCLTKSNPANLTPFMPEGIQSVMNAIKIVIFGFFGFEAIPGLFNLIKDPEKNVPRAITWTIISAGTLYMIFTGSIILGLPRELFTHAGMPLSSVLLAEFPQLPWLVSFIDWAIIITIIGTIHSMIWAISSMLVNTCEKIAVIKGKITNKRALLLMGGATACSSLMFHNIDLLFSLTAIFIVLSYAATILPLLINKKGRSTYQILLASIGLFTAGLIFICGLLGVLSSL